MGKPGDRVCIQDGCRYRAKPGSFTCGVHKGWERHYVALFRHGMGYGIVYPELTMAWAAWHAVNCLRCRGEAESEEAAKDLEAWVDSKLVIDDMIARSRRGRD